MNAIGAKVEAIIAARGEGARRRSAIRRRIRDDVVSSVWLVAMLTVGLSLQGVFL